MEGRRKLTSESIGSYAADIERLVNCSYRTMPSEAKSVLAKERFIGGLCDENKFDGLAAALDKLTREITELRSNGSDISRKRRALSTSPEQRTRHVSFVETCLT